MITMRVWAVAVAAFWPPFLARSGGGSAELGSDVGAGAARGPGAFGEDLAEFLVALAGLAGSVRPADSLVPGHKPAHERRCAAWETATSRHRFGDDDLGGRSPIPGSSPAARSLGEREGGLVVRGPGGAIMSARWSMCSRCSVHINACWALKRPAPAMVTLGDLVRITPRARSASTAGSRFPAISASIMSRADRVVNVEATESILIPLSSRTFARRCNSLVRCSMSFLR